MTLSSDGTGDELKAQRRHMPRITEPESGWAEPSVQTSKCSCPIPFHLLIPPSGLEKELLVAEFLSIRHCVSPGAPGGRVIAVCIVPVSGQ